MTTVAYNKALEDAISVLDKIAMTVDVKDRKFYLIIFFLCFKVSGSFVFIKVISVCMLLEAEDYEQS